MNAGWAWSRGWGVAAALGLMTGWASGYPPDITIEFDELPRQPADGLTLGPVTFWTGPDVFFNETVPGVEGPVDDHALVGSRPALYYFEFDTTPKYFGFHVGNSADGTVWGTAWAVTDGPLWSFSVGGGMLVPGYFYLEIPDAEVFGVWLQLSGSASRVAIDNMQLLWKGGPGGLPIPEGRPIWVGLGLGVMVWAGMRGGCVSRARIQPCP